MGKEYVFNYQNYKLRLQLGRGTRMFVVMIN
jgi:hypothetical protein